MESRAPFPFIEILGHAFVDGDVRWDQIDNPVLVFFVGVRVDWSTNNEQLRNWHDPNLRNSVYIIHAGGGYGSVVYKKFNRTNAFGSGIEDLARKLADENGYEEVHEYEYEDPQWGPYGRKTQYGNGYEEWNESIQDYSPIIRKKMKFDIRGMSRWNKFLTDLSLSRGGLPKGPPFDFLYNEPIYPDDILKMIVRLLIPDAKQDDPVWDYVAGEIEGYVPKFKAGKGANKGYVLMTVPQTLIDIANEYDYRFSELGKSALAYDG